ncbi:MAG TPA: hypothetical protein VMW65_00390 [Chloroflexota bacterium]|nr:hypothetical protein [Chloroflexota bacterium]
MTAQQRDDQKPKASQVEGHSGAPVQHNFNDQPGHPNLPYVGTTRKSRVWVGHDIDRHNVNYRLVTLSTRQSANSREPDPRHNITATGTARTNDAQRQNSNQTRPRALVPLYVVYGGLASGEFAATEIGRARGAAEANPATFFNGDVRLQAGLAAGVGTLTIWMTDHQWKHGHRVAAIVTMAIVDGINAAVLWHDARWLKNH